MKKTRNTNTDTILKEYNMKEKYANKNQNPETLAQFQLKHCRLCKNKTTNLCEIRKDTEGNFRCVYEEK